MLSTVLLGGGEVSAHRLGLGGRRTFLRERLCRLRHRPQPNRHHRRRSLGVPGCFSHPGELRFIRAGARLNGVLTPPACVRLHGLQRTAGLFLQYQRSIWPGRFPALRNLRRLRRLWRHGRSTGLGSLHF
jgi:hypothetical protein